MRKTVLINGVKFTGNGKEIANEMMRQLAKTKKKVTMTQIKEEA